MAGYLIITVVDDDIQPPINQTKKKKHCMKEWQARKKHSNCTKTFECKKMKTFCLFVS